MTTDAILVDRVEAARNVTAVGTRSQFCPVAAVSVREDTSITAGRALRSVC
jgi:hypothetical protein